MKKRLLLLPLFIILLTTIISAPSYNSDNHYNNYNKYNSFDFREKDYKYIFEKNDIETVRTFLIKHDKGPNYYRTYENFNKAKLHKSSKHPSKNQRGIYRSFFDHDVKDNSDEFCDIDCPKGWKCKKE